MSRYLTACDQFYQAFPALVLQAKTTGVRRPGYEAIVRLPLDIDLMNLALLYALMQLSIQKGIPG